MYLYKTGEPDNDQQGKIYGIIFCPPMATEVVAETPFMNKMCECLSPGYITQNDKCVPLKLKTPSKTGNKNK